MDDTLYKYHFVQNEALLLNETPLLPSLSISVLSQVKTLSIPCYTLREWRLSSREERCEGSGHFSVVFVAILVVSGVLCTRLKVVHACRSFPGS